MDKDKARATRDPGKAMPAELKDIPESVLQTFLESAMRDAQRLLDSGAVKGDFKPIVYSLYRAYVLGMIFEKK